MKACIENFSRNLIRIKLAPPVTPTIFIDLISFTPGQPDSASNPEPLFSLPNAGHRPDRLLMHGTPQRVKEQQSPTSPSSSVPPPPPWSRSNAAAPAPSLRMESIISFKRKRKSSMSEHGRESVLVFEVDPHSNNVGSSANHQPYGSTTSELNIIVSDPSQMAAQQAAQARQKASPTNGHPPPLLPPIRVPDHRSPPQRHAPPVSLDFGKEKERL